MPAPGFFTDDSMLRTVHREIVVALSGQRALLMQAADPVAFAGFFANSSMIEAPYERLERTAQVMDTVAFGSREEAERMTRRVRAMHRRVRGELTEPAGRFPAGTPYAADDPVLLLWVLATLVDSALLVYERYVRGLTRDERDAYWQDYKVIGNLFGLADADMPGSIEDFEAYVDDKLSGDDLYLTPDARALGKRIVLQPPVPTVTRPLLELANQITTGWLPDRIRRAYGLSWDPGRTVALRGGAEYAKRVVIPLLPTALRYSPSARAA